MPDKRLIAASFSRAAARYDSAAELQRQVGQRLLSLLPCPSSVNGREVKAVQCLTSPRPLAGAGARERVNASPSPACGRGSEGEREITNWLDIGCGSGHFSRILAARYPNAQGTALDLAQGMLLHARKQGGAEHWIAADAEHLPFANHSFELLFSNLCLQWCSNLAQVLSEAQRVLRPGGWLAFTSLASGTLTELHSAWQSVDNFTHVNRFRTFTDYQNLCAKSGLTLHQLDCCAEQRYYPTLRDLTFELKTLGAHNINPNRPPGLGGRKRLAAMTQAYKRLQSEQGLPATWQVVYGVLQKEH